MKKYVLMSGLAALLFTGGCATTIVQPVISNQTEKLPRGAAFYVVIPQDGAYKKDHYKDSGRMVAREFDLALSDYAESVIIGPRMEATSELMSTAKEKKCAYLILPKITHWEDRATEWSGMPDKMELSVKVFRVDDGTLMASADLKGKSAWATLGGDRPEDLLKVPVQNFVKLLFEDSEPRNGASRK